MNETYAIESATGYQLNFNQGSSRKFPMHGNVGRKGPKSMVRKREAGPLESCYCWPVAGSPVYVETNCWLKRINGKTFRCWAGDL